MKKALLTSFVAACAWACPSAAQVQPIPLDSLIVEVNSRASPLLGAGTRAIEVIDSMTIRNSPANSIVDLLGLTFGVEAMPRSPALTDVAIRGSSFEQVLVLVDGVRMRDAQTGHFNLNLTVPLEQVERIEILRGPAASLYGSDAMAGVINIVTRKAGAAASARLSRGSFATTDAAMSFRDTFASLTTDVALGYQTSDGHRPGTDFDIGQGRLAVAVPLAGEPLRAEIAYAARDFGADGFYGPYPSFEATRTATASARWRVALNELGSLEPLVSYRRNTDDFMLDRANPSLSRNEHTTDQFNADLIARTSLTDQLQLAAGVHTRYEDIRSSALGKHSEWATAGSLEVAAGPTADLALTAGLRGDRLPSGDAALSPSFSLGWSPLPGFRIRSSGGRSFRAPTWTERHYPGPPTVGIGNPDLDPERAWTIDTGLEFQSEQMRIGATAYLRTASDLIDWARPVDDPQAAWVARNVDSADFSGIEAEIDVHDIQGFRIRAQGHWLSLESSSGTGLVSKYALRPRAENTSISVERAFGAVHGSVRALRERRVGEAPHTLLDARLAVELGGIRIWGDLRNAIDTEYQDISFNPAMGRSFSIGAEWRQIR